MLEKNVSSDSMDWMDPNDDSIAYPTIEGVAVYTNNRNMIVIRQHETDHNDSRFIFIPPAMVPTLIRALRKAVKDA